MNFNEIFLLKLKLDLGLMEIKAIQDWADAKILNDHNDQIALNICYSKNDSEILNYINHLIITSEEKNQDQLKSVVALFILKSSEILILIQVLKQWIYSRKQKNLLLVV